MGWWVFCLVFFVGTEIANVGTVREPLEFPKSHVSILLIDDQVSCSGEGFRGTAFIMLPRKSSSVDCLPLLSH